jgi:hypothetical protein
MENIFQRADLTEMSYTTRKTTIISPGENTTMTASANASPDRTQTLA